MAERVNKQGFSVAEVLIAVGILAVAMIFIAGVFPVGIRFTQVSIDRTTAAIAANEAFAKIQLYCDGVSPDVTLLRADEQRDFNDWFDDTDILDDYFIDVNTFSYPTDSTINFDDKQYCWSALLRWTSEFTDANIPSRDVQATVFVCRRAGPAAEYYKPDLDSFGSQSYGGITQDTDQLPRPVRIEVEDVLNRDNELKITDSAEKTLINDGDLIIDDPTGRIYRVLERYKNPDDIILLDKDFIRDNWRGGLPPSTRYVWVVPPSAPMGSQKGKSSNIWQVRGKSPCVGVYQKVIRF
jgi:hypothetical protein